MKANLNGIEIFYEIKGRGKPLIFVHGNMGSHKEFDTLARSLEGHYTCYLIDSRDHGESSYGLPLNYDEMADDLYQFIKILDIKKPSLFGFSDGAIIGMLLAMKHPHIFDKLVLAGGNLTPEGVKVKFQKLTEEDYERTKSPYIELMLKEPNILKKDLKKILCPTLVLAGENDVIKKSETLSIHQGIPHSKIIIFPDQNHESYIVSTDFLKTTLIDFLK